MENHMYLMSKNRNLTDQNYTYGKKMDFVKSVKENFEIIKYDGEWIEISLGKIKSVIYYGGEHDDNSSIMEEGPIFIDMPLGKHFTPEKAKSLFGKFVKENKSFLFLMDCDNDTTELVLE
jgi:hypothetical protein